MWFYFGKCATPLFSIMSATWCPLVLHIIVFCTADKTELSYFCISRQTSAMMVKRLALLTSFLIEMVSEEPKMPPLRDSELLNVCCLGTLDFLSQWYLFLLKSLYVTLKSYGWNYQIYLSPCLCHLGLRDQTHGVWTSFLSFLTRTSRLYLHLPCLAI